MKFLVVLSVLVIQCAVTKSWSGDSYSEETFSLFGWVSYLKRLSLIVLMFSGVVLYYVPESRPHARRICYALIDFTANGLKSALSARESEYMYEQIKSKYHHAKYEQSLITQKRHSQIQENEENFMLKNRGRKTSFVDDVGVREKKKVNGKQNKDHRVSRHLRSNLVNNSSPTEIGKSMYLYSDKMDDLQKYVKANNGATIENYALLISGSPQQMARLDHKYEKDGVVIVQDPYLRTEYKERGTSTDQLSSKADASGSEPEGPTRDHNDHEPTDSRMETFVKDIDLSSSPEDNVLSRNGCSMSSRDLNTFGGNISTMADIKNVLKSSKSLLNSKTLKKIEGIGASTYHVNFDTHHDSWLLKSNHLASNRKVDFQKNDKDEPQECGGNVARLENTRRYVRRKKSRTGEPLTGFCCSDVSYFTDRGGEADDENSMRGCGVTTNHDIDETPQREDYMFHNNSEDSILDIYEDFCAKPLLKNRLKPALVRAVNWIFGGCPEASRKADLKHSVGKEESRESIDEWLL